MTMPASNAEASSTSARIFGLIASLPTNPDGSVYFRPHEVDRAVGATTNGHTSTVINQRAKNGAVEVLRHARRIVGVRVKNAAPQGSQTERIRAVLVAYADDHGKVALSVMDLQVLVAARDQHDTTKALWDLRERGVLTLHERKDGNRTMVDDIRLTKQGRVPTFVAVEVGHKVEDMPALVQDRDGYAKDRVLSDLAAARQRRGRRAQGPTPVATMSMPEQAAEAESKPVPLAIVDDRVAAERFPLIAELLNRPKQYETAAEALSALGPDYDQQALDLLAKAETCFTPFEAEVVALWKEVTITGPGS